MCVLWITSEILSSTQYMLKEKEEKVKVKEKDLTDGDTESETPRRANWGRPLEFILACIGYAIGLGNVWRFPYLCYRNGGGAFLVPYLLMVGLIGLPLFFLELYLGQFTGLGPLKAFCAISPFYSGLGYCTLVVISLITIYYMIIVAWTLFYTLVSITGNLDWGSCDNDFNTDFCYSGMYDAACRKNNTGTADDLTYYLRQCMSIGDICEMSGFKRYNALQCLKGDDRVPWFINVTRILASEEYYNERVLGKGDATWENWGTMQWHLVWCLIGCWVVAYFCVIKGVQTSGKVVYFTSLFPYIMLTVLLIRGVTLEGAGDGIWFYLTPEWSNLLKARVWGDAASQTFYTFGVACGSLITLASYNKFDNNCHFDAIFVCFTDYFTSIYAGLAVFAVLGFQAMKMGVSIHDVADQGPGLAFVTYPEAVLQMTMPQVWSISFFFMLFILGIGCQFAGIEAISTAIMDQWPKLRKRYWMVTAFTCFACFILELPMCYSGGVFLFTLLDWNTASWAVLLIGIAECAAVSWSYGANRAINDLATMGIKLTKVSAYYWRVVWSITSPAVSLGILFFVLADWAPPSLADYVLPLSADILGWMIGLSTLVLFPVGVVWAICNGYRGWDIFRPTPDWKPGISSSMDATPNTVITVNTQ